MQRYENLQQCRDLGVPVLAGIAAPGAEQRQAHLPAAVQIRVETHLSRPRGGEVDFGRAIGVGVVEVDVVLKGAVPVWRAAGPHYHRLHHIHAVLVAADENGVRVLYRQSAREVGQLLCQSDHFRLWRLRVRQHVGRIVVFKHAGLLILYVHVVKAQVLQE